jgi:hypothetical protein
MIKKHLLNNYIILEKKQKENEIFIYFIMTNTHTHTKMTKYIIICYLFFLPYIKSFSLRITETNNNNNNKEEKENKQNMACVQ